ncbi:MAG: elongation factor P [Phycisphaerae bacterium]|jgi:elongation factor P
MLIRHQDHVYEVTDFQEHHAGKQKPTVHVSLRDVRDGRPVDRNLDALMPIQEVAHAYRRMQYLYPRGPARVFMDAETFEEIELGPGQLGGRADFLVEGQEYRVAFIDGRPAALEMPDNVSIKVTFTAPPGHSIGGGSNITKEATLENGLEIRVPLFVKTGDVIRVDTRSRSYAGKDKGD